MAEEKGQPLRCINQIRVSIFFIFAPTDAMCFSYQTENPSHRIIGEY